MRGVGMMLGLLMCGAAFGAPGDSPADPLRGVPVNPQSTGQGIEDTGLNVLLDSAHDVSFAWMWDIQHQLREALGYRVSGNQATLSTILRDGATARMRDQSQHTWNTHRPFRWTEVATRYHVVLTYQFGARQPYLPEEIAALEAHARAGGGIVLVAHGNRTEDFPLADLAARWGATLGPRVTGPVAGDAARWPREPIDGGLRSIILGDGWTSLADVGAASVAAQRSLGQGRIVLLDAALLTAGNEIRPEPFDDVLKLAAGRQARDDGPRAVPWEPGGVGGAFYPELEFKLGGVTVIYAACQRPGVVAVAREKLPEVQRLLDELIPSPPWPGEEYYIDLAAGSPGSGWAVNAFTPKSASMTCDESSADGILSVAAHELAHTMLGPAASDGSQRAGWPPFWSEAHAGYFQRLVGERLGLNDGRPAWWTDPNAPPPHPGCDLGTAGGGEAWNTAWWIWRQIDLRHGPGWYPRWIQRVYERGVGRTDNPVDLETIILTTSAAVGADVRPIFERAAGR